MDGQAAWLLRFQAKFQYSQAVPLRCLGKYFDAHRLSQDEIQGYLAGYGPDDEAYLWHFAEVAAVPPKLRIKARSEQSWVLCQPDQLVEPSLGTQLI